MRKICFISYRRQDNKIVAENIHHRIDERYHGRVFYDSFEVCENGVKPGEDFVRKIEERIQKSAVMLVIVGPEWERLSHTKHQQGERDWVCFEIEGALNRERPVPLIPVLVEGAVMPRGEWVPEGLRRANGIALRAQHHEGYEADMKTLMSRVEDLMGPPDNPRHWNHAMLLTWLGSVIFLFLFGCPGPSEQNNMQVWLDKVQSWLGFLILLPGVLAIVLAYVVPLDQKSVLIRTLILYLGLFLLLGLSLPWLVCMDLQPNALVKGITGAVGMALLAALFARK